MMKTVTTSLGRMIEYCDKDNYIDMDNGKDKYIVFKRIKTKTMTIQKNFTRSRG